MTVTPRELRGLADTNSPELLAAYNGFVDRATDLALKLESDLGRGRDSSLARGLLLNLNLAGDLDLSRDLNLPRALTVALDLSRDLVRVLTKNRDLSRDPSLSLARLYARHLSRSLPSDNTNNRYVAGDLTRELSLVLVDQTSLPDESSATNEQSPSERHVPAWLQVSEWSATIIYVLLGVPYQLSIDDQVGDSPKPQPDALGAPPLNEMLNLSINPDPADDQATAFKGNVEQLLGQAQRLIDEGAFDREPLRLDLVERDRNFIRDEIYQTDEPFQLGDTLGGILARLEANVLAVVDLADPARELLNRVVDITSKDSPTAVPDVLDELLDFSRLDDPDWLAEQSAFEAYAPEIREINEFGARQWLVNTAHWWANDRTRNIRNEAAIGAGVGASGGGAVGLIITAFTAASFGTATTTGAILGGAAGAILAASLTWFFARYRDTPNP